MAAIDKIYVNSWDEHTQFEEWCRKQPPLTDKYGKSVKITDYLYKYDEPVEKNHPVMCAPYYIDAYIIRNCPFDFIQKELMLNYGHWSQEKIDEAYEIVHNRTESNKLFYSWLKPDDFMIVDGVITMPNLEESTYSMIKRGVLFNSPFTNQKYTVGKHFRCTKHPKYMFNTPLGCPNYWISMYLPENIDGFLWYHETHNSWDLSDEFVDDDKSTAAHIRTIRALKRHMIKWKLPIGTRVTATGRYINDTYEFIITK